MVVEPVGGCWLDRHCDQRHFADQVSPRPGFAKIHREAEVAVGADTDLERVAYAVAVEGTCPGEPADDIARSAASEGALPIQFVFDTAIQGLCPERHLVACEAGHSRRVGKQGGGIFGACRSAGRGKTEVGRAYFVHVNTAGGGSERPRSCCGNNRFAKNGVHVFFDESCMADAWRGEARAQRSATLCRNPKGEN